MARTPTSNDVNELLKLLRRIIVLSMAAYGLATEMPYLILAVRVVVLWAVLYVASGLVDVVYRRLSYSAMVRNGNSVSGNSLGSNLPSVSENRTS